MINIKLCEYTKYFPPQIFKNINNKKVNNNIFIKGEFKYE